MDVFIREDGKPLKVIKGFRDRFVPVGKRLHPKVNWESKDYEQAAEAKIKKVKKDLKWISKFGESLEGKRILEIGCGSGIDCILMSLQSVREVIGIDQRLRAFADDENGERYKRLILVVLEKLGLGKDLEEAFQRLPLQFKCVDSRELPFPDSSFDWLVSRSTLEHIKPIETALLEMARVVRPGGFMFHQIDPYFWYRGCHRPAVVDIPWAHARLNSGDYHRFVSEYEGAKKAEKRCRQLDELNHFTLKKWRNVIESGPFEILHWEENHSKSCEEILAMYPDITDTLADDIDHRDLIHNGIKVLLRNKK